MTTRSDLPIPDYDHLALGSLVSRVRSLTAGEVGELIAFEEGHGGRVPVLSVLRARRDQLADGAEPSGGDPNAPVPEQAPPVDAGSPVGPSSAAGAVTPPLPHGDPAQPSANHD